MAGSLVSQPYLVYGDMVMDIDELIEELAAIADLFYDENGEAGAKRWKAAIPMLEVYLASCKDENVLTGILTKGLVPGMQAMEEKDFTLLADIITFEIIERMKGR